MTNENAFVSENSLESLNIATSWIECANSIHPHQPTSFQCTHFLYSQRLPLSVWLFVVLFLCSLFLFYFCVQFFNIFLTFSFFFWLFVCLSTVNLMRRRRPPTKTKKLATGRVCGNAFDKFFNLSSKKMTRHSIIIAYCLCIRKW